MEITNCPKCKKPLTEENIRTEVSEFDGKLWVDIIVSCHRCEEEVLFGKLPIDDLIEL